MSEKSANAEKSSHIPEEFLPISEMMGHGRYTDAAKQLIAKAKEKGLPAPAWMQLGMCFRKIGRFHAALGCYLTARDAGLPEDEVFLTRMANIYVDLDALDLALDYSQRALSRTNDRVVRFNHANVLRSQKKFSDAIDFYDGLLRDYPEDGNYEWERAFTRMYLGLDREAWEGFDARFKSGHIPRHPIMEIAPRWAGQPLAGKSIYLMNEQGFGDAMLMWRYIPLLKERGAQITLECRPELRRLADGLGVKTIAEPSTVHGGPFDYYCALMSLPAYLGEEYGCPPQPVKIVIPPEAKADSLSRIQIPDDGKLNVGIVWSGSKTFRDNRRRSAGIGPFLELAAHSENTRFISLQKGPEERELHRSAGNFLIRDVARHLKDFADTAALIERLDLIVMTDSSVAHLAGSMGKPVLNLLQYKPYWLYFPETVTTDWYPSMRLLRQEQVGRWDRAITSAAESIGKLAAEKFESGQMNGEADLKILDQSQGKWLMPEGAEVVCAGSLVR